MEKFRIMFLATALIVIAGLALAQPTKRPNQKPKVAVDLELVLAVDVSGSMDDVEHKIQREGYAAALEHPQIASAITSGGRQRIGLIYIEWAGPGLNEVIVPWTLIKSAADARAFAAKLRKVPRANIRGTSISGGLDYAGTLFGQVFKGDRRVIDISGDGPNNRGRRVEDARDALIKKGIVINGLPLMIDPSSHQLGVGGTLDQYYRDCVIGGIGAFVVAVHNVKHIAGAIRRKLLLEIAGRPATLERAFLPKKKKKIDCLSGEKSWRWRLDSDDW